jgi:2'-5' RNA ligase
MRIFTGIAIPQAITDRLETVVASLRPTAAIRWSPLANLHITTKFIGAWAEDRLEELKQALSVVRIPPNLKIDVTGFDFFPNPRHPKVFFASVLAPGLETLHAGIENALEPLGCARDDRAFSPHLTLARIGRDDVSGLCRRMADLKQADLKQVDFGSFTAAGFHLYLSRPTPRGSVYTPLASFGFTEREAIAC